MKFRVFKDSKDLVDFANKFILDERLASLKKDVHDCLDKDCAFPALLYCFSTIDLFGALHSGHAESGSHTEANFKNYAIHFMKNTGTKYTSEQTDLLQNIYRHKVTHLAQPKLVINHRNRLFAWRYEYPDILNHLKIEQLPRTQIRNMLTPKPIYYDHIFTISITKLLSDIIDSVIREPDGYMAKLKINHKSLQIKFDDAIDQIYSIPTIA